MSLPVGLSTVTVTANELRPDGTGRIGTITFHPSVPLVSSTYDVELSGPVTMRFTGDGTPQTAVLVATDAAGVLPTGFTYSVEQWWTDAPSRTYSIALPAATPTVNLADLTPVAADTGDVPAASTFGLSLLSASGAAAARTALGVAPVQLARPGNRVVVMGASIENLSSFVQSNSVSFGKDWPTYAMLLSAGRFNLVQNQAIGGQTTQQFIDRFDTDVTPFAPNIVPLGSVENDIQAYGALGYTLAQMMPLFQANIRTLTAKCRAIGAVPVWRSAMPHFSTGVHTATGAYNAWIKDYCAREGLPFVDFHEVLVDPTTGIYRVGLTAEPGAPIHPNEEGAYRLAQYWLQQMDSMLPPGAFPVPQAATDTGLLLPTPLFTTGSAGTPTTWNPINGTPAGTTRSLVADPLGYGQLSRHQHINSATATAIQNNSGTITPAQAAVGDVLEISGRFSCDTATCPVVVTVTITTDGTSPSLSRIPVSVISHQIENASYHMTLPPIPPGFLRLQVLLQAGPGTGTVDFAYPVIRNRTKEGSWPT